MTGIFGVTILADPISPLDVQRFRTNGRNRLLQYSRREPRLKTLEGGMGD
jgi:hypothetical protein